MPPETWYGVQWRSAATCALSASPRMTKKSPQYQLWIFDKGRDVRYPVDGGVFDVSAAGEVVIPITAKLAIGQPTLFAVTVETPGGVVVSERKRIVVTASST